MNPTQSLYEKDYHLWLHQTAQQLREGNFHELDLLNLIEEIEDMGKTQKKALRSNLRVLLRHLLKYLYQPEKRTNSWLLTIRKHRKRLLEEFEDSPSLKPYYEQVYEKCYADAREEASDETGLTIDTFPSESPFTTEQAIDLNYLPNQKNIAV